MSPELGSQTWPSDLLFLRARFPRESWASSQGLGDLAHFWLAKHDALRGLGAGLNRAGAALRDGQLSAVQFQSTFVPPLGQFLGSLESHHQVEDHHYFPIFRSAEPRLARGFDILESDHGIIHAQIVAAVDAARALTRQSGGDRGALLSRAEDYVHSVETLVGSLAIHLSDEEDLVIPLLASQSG